MKNILRRISFPALYCKQKEVYCKALDVRDKEDRWRRKEREKGEIVSGIYGKEK